MSSSSIMSWQPNTCIALIWQASGSMQVRLEANSKLADQLITGHLIQFEFRHQTDQHLVFAEKLLPITNNQQHSKLSS